MKENTCYDTETKSSVMDWLMHDESYNLNKINSNAMSGTLYEKGDGKDDSYIEMNSTLKPVDEKSVSRSYQNLKYIAKVENLNTENKLESSCDSLSEKDNITNKQKFDNFLKDTVRELQLENEYSPNAILVSEKLCSQLYDAFQSGCTTVLQCCMQMLQYMKDENFMQPSNNSKNIENQNIEIMIKKTNTVDVALLQSENNFIKASSNIFNNSKSLDTMNGYDRISINKFSTQPSALVGSNNFFPPTILAHPDEFKNPSSFLKIYGDPMCKVSRTISKSVFKVNGNTAIETKTLPSQGSYGNWRCLNCENINFPRRFKCNKCQEPRDEIGDQIVTAYAKYVYAQHLRTYQRMHTAVGNDNDIGGTMLFDNNFYNTNSSTNNKRATTSVIQADNDYFEENRSTSAYEFPVYYAAPTMLKKSNSPIYTTTDSQNLCQNTINKKYTTSDCNKSQFFKSNNNVNTANRNLNKFFANNKYSTLNFSRTNFGTEMANKHYNNQSTANKSQTPLNNIKNTKYYSSYFYKQFGKYKSVENKNLNTIISSTHVANVLCDQQQSNLNNNESKSSTYSSFAENNEDQINHNYPKNFNKPTNYTHESLTNLLASIENALHSATTDTS